MNASNRRFKDIDAYIQSFPPDIQKILEQLRRIIHENVPGAEEAISYGMPPFKLNGNLVHFAAFEHHIGFYPTPSEIEDSEKELAPCKHAKGSFSSPWINPSPMTW